MTVRPAPAAALLLAVLALLACGGCTADAADRPAAGTGSVAVPTAPAGLARLLLTRVPSGLPRVPDDELTPAAGRKTVDDVAGYAPDPQRQRAVLADYGYRWGWERFWRSGNALTSVFVDQFDRRAGAGSYAEDLAANDEEYYGGRRDDAPSGLPAGCALLTVDTPPARTGMTGPAALAWCSKGLFSVSVAAVSSTPERARAELAAVVAEQLGRLPES